MAALPPPLEGCRILLLRDGAGAGGASGASGGGAVAVSPGAVVALGAELSVHGEPPLAANTLTHIVARGGWPAVVTAAPSLARRFDPAQPDGPPRQAQLPRFVSTTWLEECVRTGRRAAEELHVFELGPRGARRPRSQEGEAAGDAGNEDGERPRQLRRTAAGSGQEGQPIDLADSQGSQGGAPDEPAPPPPPPQYRQQRDDDEEEAECVKLLVKLFETATVGAEPRYEGDTDGAQRCIKAAAKFLQNEAAGASKRKSLNCEKTERYLCGCDKREGGCGGPHAPHGVLTMRLLTLVGFRVIRSGSGESSVRHLACPAADGRANLRHGVHSRLRQMKATIDQEIAAEHARRKGEVEKLLEAMREAAAFRSGLSESSVAASNEAASSDKKKAAGVRRHDIAGIRVAFFSRCHQYRCYRARWLRWRLWSRGRARTR